MKKSHLEERFLNSAKRANLPLKSLSKGTGDKIHFGRRYFIDCYSREFFSNASLLSPETLLLLYKYFFQISCWLCQRTRCSSLCRFAHQRNKGRRGEFWIKTNIALLVEMWGLPSIPTQILDICDFLFLLHYIYTITLLLKSGEVKNVTYVEHNQSNKFINFRLQILSLLWFSPSTHLLISPSIASLLVKSESQHGFLEKFKSSHHFWDARDTLDQCHVRSSPLPSYENVSFNFFRLL